MVERFQQKPLASSLTGLPREDHSMSKAAALIAQAADRSRDLAMQTAASDFARAGALFNQAGYQARALTAGMGGNKAAAEEERRRMQVALARIDEDDAANAMYSSFKEKFAGNPQEAVAAFKAEVPNMRASFRQRYGNDPIAMRMLLPVHHQNEQEVLGRLSAWAEKASNANLESRLRLLPEELTDRVANLGGSISEQFEGLQKIYRSSSDIYEAMYNSAQDEATRNDIKFKRYRLENTLAKSFVDHLTSQTPDGEEGISYIKDLEGIITNSRQLGLPLAPNDQKHAVEQLRSFKRDQERDVLDSVSIDGTLQVYEAKKVMRDILNASEAGNTGKLKELAGTVNKRMDMLDQKVAELEKEPDSDIKKAKIAEYRKEQDVYISELGKQLGEQRTIQRIEWAVQGMARAQAATARAIANESRRATEREIRMMEKEERRSISEAQEKRLSAFNDQWSSIMKRKHAAYALPAGKQQQMALKAIADEALPVLDNALKSGTIKPDSWNSYTESLQKSLVEASQFKTSKPANIFGFQWGGGQTTKLKKEDATKARMKAEQEWGALVKSKRSTFDDLDAGYKMLGTLTTNKGEEARLRQFMSERLPKMLESQKYKTLPPAERQAELARRIKNMVMQHRQGTLK